MIFATTNWPTATLGSLCEQVRGVSYSKGDASDTPSHGLLPLLRANNILDDGRLAFDDLIFVPPRVVSPSQMLRRGDVVVAASSGSLSVVGKAAPVLSEWSGAFGAFCKVLRPNNKVDPRYFAYFFRTASYRHRISQLAAGVNINNLRNEHLDELEIPLPPVSAQKRIADILDKADVLRRKRREVIAQLEDYPHALFMQIVGHPDRNPRGWPMMTFGAIADSRLGKMLDAKQQTGKHRRPYMRNLNVQWGHLDLSEVFEMDFDADERAEFRLQYGDVLICEGGAGVGQTAIWRDELPECYFQKSLHRVRPYADKSTSEFIAFLMWTLMRGSSLLRSISSATIPHLTGVKLKQVRIPVPPIELQKEFQQEVQRYESARDNARRAARESDALFNSLVQRAFGGEL